MKQNSSRKGFTLIEMLIVIAIIGILSSIVLVGLGPIQRRGRDARRQADLRQVQNALELYYNKCGYYPGLAAGGSDAPSPPPGVRGCTGYSVNNGWTGMTDALTQSFLGVSKIPNDPSFPSKTYEYASDGDTGSSYVLSATLEDGSNPSLKDDVDDPTFGNIDCADPVYCITF